MKASDGAPITYYVAGEGKPFIIANGLGGSSYSLRPIINASPKGWKFITWDYRGLYNSVPVGKDTDLSIARHTQDMVELMEIENVKSAVFLGWSMGVQVVLDFAGNNPERAEAVIALNGTFGDPFLTAFNLPYVDRAIPYFWKGLKVMGPFFKYPSCVLGRLNVLGHAAKITRIVTKDADVDVMNVAIRDYTSFVNLDTYAEIFLELGKHSAWDVLSDVKAPTLIIAGEKDILTPICTAHQMMEVIPNVELFMLEGGSHFCVWETPDIITDRIGEFLAGTATNCYAS